MLIPLRGKIVAEIIPDIKQTASGLYLAENIKDIPHRAKVISIGKPYIDKKGREKAWELRIGEIIHFKRKWNEFYKEDNKDLVVVLRDDIVAIENDDGIRAANDLVLIKRVYTGKIGNSSIVVPDGLGIQSNYEDFYGEVISAGPDNKLGLFKEDRIAYHRNEGIVVKYAGEELFSLKPRAILAVFQQELTAI